MSSDNEYLFFYDVKYWVEKINIKSKNLISTEFLLVIEKVRKNVDLPGKSDLEAATQGLLRVQDAYNFDINEVGVDYWLYPPYYKLP